MARKIPRKKILISKGKDYHKPKMIELADGTKVMERYHNDYGAKPVYQKTKKDPEKSKKPFKDEFSKLKFPPPKRNRVFRERWAGFIDSLTSRENFKKAHLQALEVLCDLYVEYVDLESIIRKEGRTYKSVTRFGESRHMHPAVGQLDKVRANIRQYTKQLDLFPKKDNSSEGEGEEEEWD
jgi:phage terminase small subunit